MTINEILSTGLNIAATQATPEIQTDFAQGIMTMRGDSYPENSFEFFGPVLDWVEQFLAHDGRPLRLELHIVYMNTSSVKAMMDLFDLLEAAHQEGKQVAVNWSYDPRNERVVEMVEEFKEDCTFTFNINPEA
ncbi:biofilm regulation phosphoprotein SiaC [Salinispirillum sp. LH 10-3-1]|uniref:Biofilm regulation phosphoprotein SiaC n=1 Tax=Salinispirillum sp. LH 10-3-1 TaxID=2952525 RepID=A0AB38YDW6_9GAMM